MPGKINIQSKFCILKCDKSGFTPIELKYCTILKPGGSENDLPLFRKIYGFNCCGGRTLDWSKNLKMSDLKEKGSLRILLPGIYEKIYVKLPDMSTLNIQRNEAHLKVSWHDKEIMKSVPISLQLHNKQYYIFAETLLTDKMPHNITFTPYQNEPQFMFPKIHTQRSIYSWDEAEDFCIQHGGHLPSFSSQSDVDDLMNILIHAAWTGPIRMIHIGLKVSTHTSIPAIKNKD